MKISNRILATVAVAALAVTACADGGDESTAPSPETETAADVETSAGTETADEGAAPADGEATAVDIDDFSYKPASITVSAGSEVTWTNQDPALHSVTAGTPDAPEPEVFDLDPIEEAGQTVSHTFEDPGTYEYFCRYHDFMLGTVEVTG